MYDRKTETFVGFFLVIFRRCIWTALFNFYTIFLSYLRRQLFLVPVTGFPLEDDKKLLSHVFEAFKNMVMR